MKTGKEYVITIKFLSLKRDRQEDLLFAKLALGCMPQCKKMNLDYKGDVVKVTYEQDFT